MKDRMERLVVLPFSIGCVSQSSVAVSENHPKKSKQEPNSSPPKGGGESLSVVKMKNSFGFLPFPKSNMSAGLHKLIKSFKIFSQLHVYKEDDDEMGMDIEIGLPKDVKHVTHIGWDGPTTNSLKGWDGLKAPELLSLPSVSLRQFEFAMGSTSRCTSC